MNKYPFIKQEGIKDCGPACLFMIIKYYKGNIPLENIRELSKTNKHGTDAYHLIEAAKEIGFIARGIKSDLDKEIILPAIAHVILDNGLGHYVVIYKINKKKEFLVIGDPAKGNYKIKIGDFLKVWDNILIELIPERNIPIVSEVSIMQFLVNYLKKYKKIIFSLFSNSLLITILSCIFSFYFRIIIELTNTSEKNLTLVLLLFIIIYLLKCFLEYVRCILFVKFRQKMDMDISCDLFDSIVDLPYKYYRNRTTGEIISRFDDLEYVRQILYSVVFFLFSDLPFMCGSLMLLLIINTNLTFLSIILIAIYMLSVLFFSPILKKYISRIQEQGSITNSFMTEVIGGFETVKNCSLKTEIKEKFADKYYKLLNFDEKYSNLVNIRNSLGESIYQIGLLLIIYFGSILVFKSVLSIGNLIMFYSIFMSFSGPLKNMIQIELSLANAKNALKRMLSIFVKQEEKGIINNIDKKDIKINNLNFYYNDIDLILKDINLHIKSNEKVLILGKSGSGKSTLLKLIMKYYKVNNNTIFIDKIDINNYTTKAIEKNIGYISQQEILFTDSIINNLGSNDMYEILKISKICEIQSILNTRNLNFYSLLEENGFNLSGGERQRIILGRLLLQNFNILLIDEGLNQIDINLERIILKNIFKYYKNKTIIIVSHRMDNMDLYDHVVELSNGKIIKDVIRNEK